MFCEQKKQQQQTINIDNNRFYLLQKSLKTNEKKNLT